MERQDPNTYLKIIEQDHCNVRRHGVGNAMAQAFNHTILPLASYRDKVTQVAWGIADFKHRFGRQPQGMWLPETAADTETLEVLAAQGIEFTILAPWQAKTDQLDPTEPYWVKLPGQRQIAVFFYERELSSKVSFDSGATINADNFARYILQPRFRDDKLARGEPQLILMASDGELYGHHQHLRDHFLARLVDGASSQIDILPTYPALWLQAHPPRRSIAIRERTSWSCHHGVGRWNGSCPCTPGDGNWKAQMRYALDKLADRLDRLYQEVARQYVEDPWALRDRYIHVMLNECSLGELVGEMAGFSLNHSQQRRLGLMLEAQRERQRMFTSCGWFFDDFDRIEPKNNLAYAAQAICLAHVATGVDLEKDVLADLRTVASQRTHLRASSVLAHHLQRAKALCKS
jgi:alpha-amylase/alpha-mannosidase (GH57 family)